jgi:hypothetical protein
MKTRDTSEIMRRFNDALLSHQPEMLDDLVADDCVMESIQPAPDGTRLAVLEAYLAFWQALAGARPKNRPTDTTAAAALVAPPRSTIKSPSGACRTTTTAGPHRGPRAGPPRTSCRTSAGRRMTTTSATPPTTAVAARS